MKSYLHDDDLRDSLTATGKRRLGNKRSGTALLSQAEVGAMFGVTLQSVQSVEYRALRKIRQAIEREAAAAGQSVRQWLYGD